MLPLPISPRKISANFLALLFLLPAAHGEPFTTAADPKQGLITVIDESGPYLDFSYYDWDVGWGNVDRKAKATSEGEKVSFQYDTTFSKSSANFTVTGSWTHPQPDTFRFEAALVPAASAPLTMAMFAINPAEGRIVSATATLADGSTQEFPVPFGKAPLGNNVKVLSYKDTSGDLTTLTFDAPTKIVADKAARLVLVGDQMEKDRRYSMAFTLKLPAATKFLTSADVRPAHEGWYEFKGESPIPTESEWSLASWIEAPAGKHGRIARKDDQLIYHGTPIKLWGTNLAYGNCAPTKELADRRADFYAALGINAVRLHKYADGTGWAGICTTESALNFDPALLDRMDYFVAALKKRGIYIKLSPVFMIKPGEGDRSIVPYLDELGPQKNSRVAVTHGAFYISSELQDLLIRQTTAILKHVNPYTGLSYAEDPAVAYVEIYNEDDALFGGVTGNMVKSATLRARAGKLFAQWLKKKYASEADLNAAWGPKILNGSLGKSMKLPADESWAEDRIYPAGTPWYFNPENLDTTQTPYKRRLLDTMGFLFELQNQTYARCADAFRSAGYKGELVTSNWQAGRMMSQLYNLYSDSLFGTVDRHNYFGGTATFPMTNSSMLSLPGSGLLSSSLQQVDHCAFMLSEWNHVFPNEWSVEGPAILGAYGMGLQGWDVSFPFQNTDEGTFRRALGDDPWEVTTPQFLGIFPAVSRQVLRGDVKQSEITHYRNVHLPSLDSGEVGFTEKVLQKWDIKTFDSDVFPSTALAAARAVVRFTKEPEPTLPFDLKPFERNGDILSSTGQLRWHPGQNDKDGFITIDTPATQAAVGFAKDQTFNLTDSVISPKSRFGAIYLSARSLEGTIASDKAVLITAMARARNKSAVIAEDSFMFGNGNVIKSHPQGPVLMEPIVATIRLKRNGNPVVHLLDHNGVKTGKTLPLSPDGSIPIDTGRDATPYYLAEFN